MIRMLNKETLERMYGKVLEILETVGVDFDTPEAQELFRKAGATVEGNNVKMSPEFVEKYLALMPPTEPGEITERRLAATSPFGNVPIILDGETGEYRRCTVDDAVRMYKITQTSDLYECCNIATIDPIDINSEDSFTAQVAMALKYTDRWFSNGARATAGNSKDGDIYSTARRALHMIRDFYGTYEEPVCTQYVCPMSPLKYDIECLANINAIVEEGQAIGYSPCSLPVMTSPGSIMGTAIHDFAISLAGIIYVQLIAPGYFVSLSNATGMTDMKALQPAYGSPESMIMQSMFYELCLYKNIASGFCGTMADSAHVDYQAGVESFLTSFLPYYYVDTDVIWCYTGHMAAWHCGSFEKAILDEELMRYINRALKPVNTDIESELIQMMKAAKESGTFMTGRTPKEYRRDIYLTKMFSKYGTGDGVDPLKNDINEKVKQELKDRVEGYVMPERTAEQRELLNRYLPESQKF